MKLYCNKLKKEIASINYCAVCKNKGYINIRDCQERNIVILDDKKQEK
jgi:hypothetical protein